MLFCSIEVYGMKTDVIKEALESVKKEDPKLEKIIKDTVSKFLPIKIKLVFILKGCIMNTIGLIL